MTKKKANPPLTQAKKREIKEAKPRKARKRIKKVKRKPPQRGKNRTIRNVNKKKIYGKLVSSLSKPLTDQELNIVHHYLISFNKNEVMRQLGCDRNLVFFTLLKDKAQAMIAEHHAIIRKTIEEKKLGILTYLQQYTEERLFKTQDGSVPLSPSTRTSTEITRTPQGKFIKVSHREDKSPFEMAKELGMFNYVEKSQPTTQINIQNNNFEAKQADIEKINKLIDNGADDTIRTLKEQILGEDKATLVQEVP